MSNLHAEEGLLPTVNIVKHDHKFLSDVGFELKICHPEAFNETAKPLHIWLSAGKKTRC